MAAMAALPMLGGYVESDEPKIGNTGEPVVLRLAGILLLSLIAAAATSLIAGLLAAGILAIEAGAAG